LLNELDELNPIDLRHLQISDHDLVLVLLESDEGCLTRPMRVNFIALARQIFFENVQDVLFIIDDQYTTLFRRFLPSLCIRLSISHALLFSRLSA
jgi:hypothetical protein